MGTFKKISVCLSSIAVIFLFLAILPVLPGGGGVAVAANEDWTLTSMGDAYNIVDIDAVQNHPGYAWAIGAVPNGGVVLKTSNGGATWETQLTVTGDSTYRSLVSVSVFDFEHVWVGGTSAVYKTGDGGTTWETIYYSDEYNTVADICAVNHDSAWAILLEPDSTSNIFKTTDGGATWSKVYSQPMSAGVLVSISAVDTVTAWAAGSGAIGNNLPGTLPGVLIKTSDMGATWQDQTPAGGFNLMKVEAIDASTAWLAANGALMKTSDGGSTWNTAYSRAGMVFWGLSTERGNTVWATGSEGYTYSCIIKTTDGGSSWEDLFGYSGTEGWLCCIEAANASLALAGSASSTTPSSGGTSYILSTANGGSAKPDVIVVYPYVAENGETVTIEGADFGAVQGSSRVFFDGTEAASYELWSGNSLKVTIPAGLHGKCPVTVATATGVSNAFDLTVAAPVAITSVEPGTVLQFLPFAQVKITGSGFQPGAKVTFVSFYYGTNKTYDANVISDSEIGVAINPFDLGIGAHDVSVTNPDGGYAHLPASFSVMGGCGTGAGTAAVALGGMLGMLSIGQGIRRRRRRH